MSGRPNTSVLRRLWPLRLALVLVIVIGAVYGAVRHFDTSLKFNSAQWKSPPNLDGQDIPRARMVNDLMQNHLHPGMPRWQVHALLGPPDAQSENDKQKGIDAYQLGYAGFMGGIDPMVLTIYYNKTNRLIRTEAGET